MPVNASEKVIKDNITVSQAVDLDVMESDIALNNAHRLSDGVADHTGLEPRLRDFTINYEAYAGQAVRMTDDGRMAPAGIDIDGYWKDDNFLFTGLPLGEPVFLNYDENKLCFDQTTGNWVMILRDYYARTVIIIGTWDGTNVTHSTELLLWGNNYSVRPTIAYDKANDRYVAIFKDWYTSTVYYTVLQINHSTLSITKQSPVISAGFPYYLYNGLDACYDPTHGKVFFVGAQTTNIICVSGTVQLGANDSVSWGGAVVLQAGSFDRPKCDFMSATDQILVVATDEDTAGPPWGTQAYVVDLSLTSPQFQAITPYYTGAEKTVFPKVVWNEFNQRIVVSWNHPLIGESWAVSGVPTNYNVTWGNPAMTHPVEVSEVADWGSSMVTLSDGRVVDFYVSLNDGIAGKTLTLSGNDLDVSGYSVLANSGTYYAWMMSYDDFPVCFRDYYEDPDNNHYATSYRPSLKVPLVTDGISGILQENGFEDDVKKVALDGFYSTVHSGLTPGETVYIQDDATLSHTESPFPYGIAVSDTTILIGDNHQIDNLRHFTQEQIEITSSQVTDIQAEITTNNAVTLNTTHRGLTNNPHSTHASQLWNVTEQTSLYNASSNDEIHADSTGGAFTINLPSNPALGDRVRIIDAGNSFDTQGVTVGRNGEYIKGVGADYLLNLKGSFIEFVYVDDNVVGYGWTYIFYA